MCGEWMKLRVSEVTERVPGTPQTKVIQVREWVCPECDYFEEEQDKEG